MSTTTVEQPPAAAPPLPVRLRPPRTAGWWPDAVTALTWATVVWVVGLWATGGGVGALAGSPADVLGSVGRLSGLLASDLLLLQVLGMARIPWAERAFGQDRLARWHRWAGSTSFHLLLVHIATLVVSYALAAGTGVVREAWDMVTTLPGMLSATAGTALLVAVVTSSLRAARRRMRYESWHLLHLYAYLGVGLAVPHQLWTGTDFVGRPRAAVFWWALWGAAVAAVLVFRVGVPLRTSLRHRLHVDHVVPEAPGLVSIHVGGRRLEELRADAGQFFVWRFLTGAGWTRGHPLSLSAAPTSAGLRLTVGTRGDDCARLAGLRPGTRVLVEGPYGRLTPRVRTRPRLAGFAAGSGVAPVMALLHDSAWRPGTDTLVLRTSTVEETPLAADVAWLVRDRGLRYVPLTGARSTTGTTWLPADLGHVPGPDASAGSSRTSTSTTSSCAAPGPGPTPSSPPCARQASPTPPSTSNATTGRSPCDASSPSPPGPWPVSSPLFAYPTSRNAPVDAAPDSPAAAQASAGAASSAGGASSVDGSGAETSGGTAGSSGDSSSSTSTGASDGAQGSATVSGTFTGAAVQTRWGPVQVQIVVEDGRITSADAVTYPDTNGHDRQINASAIPQLDQEVVQAQSASIDLVSGATVTSDGYVRSLQDAIDQAFS